MYVPIYKYVYVAFNNTLTYILSIYVLFKKAWWLVKSMIILLDIFYSNSNLLFFLFNFWNNFHKISKPIERTNSAIYIHNMRTYFQINTITAPSIAMQLQFL